MLYRYNLKVEHDKNVVFDGNFSTLNKLVKVACCFKDQICEFEVYDELFGKTIPIYDLITEFVTSCTGI